MKLVTLNVRHPFYGGLITNMLHYSDVEPGLSEYAVEAWERQTIDHSQLRVYGGKPPFKFTLWYNQEDNTTSDCGDEMYCDCCLIKELDERKRPHLSG